MAFNAKRTRSPIEDSATPSDAVLEVSSSEDIESLSELYRSEKRISSDSRRSRVRGLNIKWVVRRPGEARSLAADFLEFLVNEGNMGGWVIGGGASVYRPSPFDPLVVVGESPFFHESRITGGPRIEEKSVSGLNYFGIE